MQDNRSQKEKDGVFEDKAWMDMRKQLDKEMPVKKKKRVLLYWWGLSGILLVLLIIGSFFIFNKIQSEFGKDNILVERKNSSITTNHDIEEVAMNKNEFYRNTVLEKHTTLPIDKVIVHSNQIPSSLEKEQHHNSNNSTDEGTAHLLALENETYSNIITNDVAITLQNQNINTRETPEEITHPLVGNPNFNNKETITHPIVRKEQLGLNNLPILELMDLPTISSAPTFPLYTIPKRTRIDWSIAAALGTFKLTRLNEYAIGIKTTFQLNSNWHLGTGLNYHYFRLNGQVRTDEVMNTISQLDDIDENMDPVDTTTDPLGGVPTTSVDSNSGDLTTPIGMEQVFVDPLALRGNVQYLSVPFFLEYQFYSNIKLDIGAAYYYRLASSYDSLEEQLKTQEWTGFVGIGYECSPSFGLHLSYERNWGKKRSDFLDTNFVRNVNNMEEIVFSDKFSPIEGRIKLSGIWRF